MQKNYKVLGNYIRKVDNKNKDLKVLNLQGLSMTKEFRKSTSNIVGTDLSKYKIVKPGQFCCDFMSVIRVHKLPVVLNNLGEDVIISPAYIVFEIIDINELLPEYLMMWFRRSEFDRYADFRCDSSIRGGFQWEELCEVELPVPTIEEQHKAVKQYQSVTNKIKVNEQICEKLEAAAQALYKHWFVDFEFPAADTEAPEVTDETIPALVAEERGSYAVLSSTGQLPISTQGYKSSGGKMVWNEELGKEIPEGWEVKNINSLCSIGSSKRIFESEYVTNGVPFYRGKEITLKKEGKVITDPYFISPDRFKELVEKYGIPKKGDILMTAVGTIGSTYMVLDEDFYFKDGNVIWFKDFKIDGINFYIYDFMQNDSFRDMISEITIGSTQSAITINTFGSQRILLPKEETVITYKGKSEKMNFLIAEYKKQNQKLTQLQSLLLSRLAVGEEVASNENL